MSQSKIYKYKTKDGRGYFEFRYVDMGDYYEIDIIKQPNYGTRNGGSVTAHWLNSDRWDCERKVCFNVGVEPDDIETAKKYSVDWAELTWKYILTGITITEQIERRN